MATVDGAAHLLKVVNSAFCQLLGKGEQEILGKPFHEILVERPSCLASLNRIFRSGKSESYMEQERTDPRPIFWSYTIWPVVADDPAICVMIQVIETAPLYEKTLAMNEALVIGSLRQHELAAIAAFSNMQLRTEAVEHKQRELDALMLTNEISHRIKNNLQVVFGLIGQQAKRASVSCARGYEAIQARIGAIAGLYDLISRSSHSQTVSLDAYLKKIAAAMSASLLGTGSGITIEVKAEAVDIDPARAVPLGLLVNELATNAIKHAFPGVIGAVVLSVRHIGDQIQLDVTDDGIGMNDAHSAQASENHGADYVAMFVRQLGGTLDRLEAKGTGTTVSIRFPLLVKT